MTKLKLHYTTATLNEKVAQLHTQTNNRPKLYYVSVSPCLLRKKESDERWEVLQTLGGVPRGEEDSLGVTLGRSLSTRSFNWPIPISVRPKSVNLHDGFSVHHHKWRHNRGRRHGNNFWTLRVATAPGIMLMVALYAFTYLCAVLIWFSCVLSVFVTSWSTAAYWTLQGIDQVTQLDCYLKTVKPSQFKIKVLH